MVCIYCSSPTRVTNSRLQKRSNSTWRRRACSSCRGVYTTIELVDLEHSLVVHSRSKSESFLRDTLYISIFESCRHRETAVTDATELTLTIIQRCLLTQTKPGLLEKELIKKISYEVLAKFDQAAATSYRAFHPISQQKA